MKKTIIGFKPTVEEDADMETAKLATGWTCSALLRHLFIEYHKGLVLEILAKREQAAANFLKTHKRREPEPQRTRHESLDQTLRLDNTPLLDDTPRSDKP